MASKVEIAPGDNPDSQLIALVTDFSPAPNSATNARLVPAIKDELGSETQSATSDQDTSPAELGMVSSIFPIALGSPALWVTPPSSAAIDDSMARETGLSGCPQRVGDCANCALVQHIQ